MQPEHRPLTDAPTRVQTKHIRASHGRRVLLYVTHTQSRDIASRLEHVLGIRVATLKADTVATDAREDWMNRRVREGIDLLLVHPRLVQTGLDLIDCPTIVWYEIEYSVYTMRQASRRSWRIGQRHPVRVIYFAYRAMLQAQALQLTAKKFQASLAVEGDLVEDGLAAHGTDGDDLLFTLARSLSAQDEVNEESLEGLFAQVRAVADAAEETLDRQEVCGVWIGTEVPGPQPVQVSGGAAMSAVRQPSAQEGEQLRLL